jgi:hypothetical protein
MRTLESYTARPDFASVDTRGRSDEAQRAPGA